MSTETTTAKTDPMSTATTTPKPRRLARHLLLALPAVAGILLLVAVLPYLQWKAQQVEQQRAKAEEERFGQVKGVVSLDGQPLGTVEVAFLPDPSRGTRGATANCYTDEEGRYTLR